MATVRYPSLYQVNTRVWLTELSRSLGRRATLDDIPDNELDHFARRGFDWIWLLSVWQTGAVGQAISRTNPEWCREFAETLPDLNSDDIAGSGFAIKSYKAHADLGGDPALARLRQRMQLRGLKLMLDFVPNHMALDHPWVEEHPDYFIAGSEIDLIRTPQNYIRRPTKNGSRLFAHGRDPYFPGWPDTIQLNYGNTALQDVMIGELLRIADQCDGVRCDMAMLVLPKVFQRTWGLRADHFWPKAIDAVRRKNSSFQFMAEVYWDLERELQQQGFDYCYDKRLYDRLREGHPRQVREHFHSELDYQDRLARFLENHDEPRAVATFAAAQHRAAAIVTFLWPGLRFFHQGQFEGRRKRISPHLIRAPEEPADASLAGFYEQLLAVLRTEAVRNGTWRPLDCVAAWNENGTCDNFIACEWEGTDGQRLLVAVNHSPNQSQCYVRLSHDDLKHGTWRLTDRMGDFTYERDGTDLSDRGLYLDLPAWCYHIFHLERF